MAASYDVNYDGSRFFSWLSDLSGLPLDQVSVYVKNVNSCTEMDFLHVS